MPVNVTVNAVSPTLTYVADGTQTEFGFPFAIFSPDDLEVYLDDVLMADGHSITINVQTVGGATGGVVVFDAPPTKGTRITLRRQLVIQRMTNFQESGELRARALNYELDYLTAALQQVEDTSHRTIRLHPTEPDARLTLPGKAVRAGKALTFDADGNIAVSELPDASNGNIQSLDDIPAGQVNVSFTAADKSKLDSVAEGAEANPANLDGIPDSASRVAMTPMERGKLAGVADGAQVNPADLDSVPDGASRVAMTPTERSKLAGVADGAQANPADLDSVPDGASRVAMTPTERGKLAGVAEGAQVNPANLDGVPDSASRVAMTTAERSKLASVAEGAEANPANLDGIPDSASRIAMTPMERGKLAGVAEGAEVNPADLDSVPDGASRVAMTPTERSKLAGVADGAQVNPASLDGVPDSASRVAMTPTERSKLAGVAEGAQVNPASLDGVPDSASRVAMTTAERSKLASVAEGAEANPANLDGIPDSASRIAMTPMERGKLAGVAEGAEVNPADLDSVPDGASRVAITPTERSKLAGVADGAEVNPVDLDGIPDSASRVAMTPMERGKLGSIASNADANPPLVTTAEIAAGSEVAARGFSPAQVKSSVAAYAPVTSVAGRTGSVTLSQTDIVGTVATTRQFTAGAGLTGGGDFSANRTIGVNFAAAGGTNGSATTVARADHAHAAATATSNGFLAAADKAKLDGIAAGAQVNPANLDGIPDSASRVAMTPTERSKLGSIASNADANPPLVTSAEIAAGSEVAARSFSPAPVKSSVAAYAPVTSVAGRTGSVTLSQADIVGTVATTRQFTTGAGLTGGGDFSADRTIGVNFPTTGGTNGSAATVARADHTHAAASATSDGLLTAADKVKLDSTLAEDQWTARISVIAGCTISATLPTTINTAVYAAGTQWGFVGVGSLKNVSMVRCVIDTSSPATTCYGYFEFSSDLGNTWVLEDGVTASSATTAISAGVGIQLANNLLNTRTFTVPQALKNAADSLRVRLRLYDTARTSGSQVITRAELQAKNNQIMGAAPSVSSVAGKTGSVTLTPSDVGVTNLDTVPDSASRVAMTPTERSKLGSIASNADVNPPLVTATEIAAGSEVAARGFSPAQVKSSVAAYAPVTSVAGRTGSVTLSQADIVGTVATTRQFTAGAGLTGGGDFSTDRTIGVNFATAGGTNGSATTVARSDHSHAAATATSNGLLAAADKAKLDGIAAGAQVNPANLDGLPDSASRVAMTPTERSKLGSIASNADANPPLVTGAEIAAGSEVTARSFSPAQVKSSVATYAPVTSVAGRTGSVTLSQADIVGTVATTRQFTAGAGLTGGGDFSADLTIGVNFPTAGGTNGSATTVARSDHSHAAATATSDGLLTAADKAKLDGVAAGAQVNPANLDDVPDSLARLAMKADERKQLRHVDFGGAPMQMFMRWRNIFDLTRDFGSNNLAMDATPLGGGTNDETKLRAIHDALLVSNPGGVDLIIPANRIAAIKNAVPWHLDNTNFIHSGPSSTGGFINTATSTDRWVTSVLFFSTCSANTWYNFPSMRLASTTDIPAGVSEIAVPVTTDYDAVQIGDRIDLLSSRVTWDSKNTQLNPARLYTFDIIGKKSGNRIVLNEPTPFIFPVSTNPNANGGAWPWKRSDGITEVPGIGFTIHREAPCAAFMRNQTKRNYEHKARNIGVYNCLLSSLNGYVTAGFPVNARWEGCHFSSAQFSIYGNGAMANLFRDCTGEFLAGAAEFSVMSSLNVVERCSFFQRDGTPPPNTPGWMFATKEYSSFNTFRQINIYAPAWNPTLADQQVLSIDGSYNQFEHFVVQTAYSGGQRVVFFRDVGDPDWCGSYNLLRDIDVATSAVTSGGKQAMYLQGKCNTLRGITASFGEGSNSPTAVTTAMGNGGHELTDVNVSVGFPTVHDFALTPGITGMRLARCNFNVTNNSGNVQNSVQNCGPGTARPENWKSARS